MTPPSGHAGDPDFERQADARSSAASGPCLERVMGATGDPPSPFVAEMLEELSAAVEELEVSTEEIHGQNEALAEAKKQLDLESARYRELFDLAPDGYLVTDPVGVILESNRAASELLGTPGHFLSQKPMVVFVDAPTGVSSSTISTMRSTGASRPGARVRGPVRPAQPRLLPRLGASHGRGWLWRGRPRRSSCALARA